MMAATRQSARPFPPLVLDDASSLEAMAGAVMRLHNTLLTIGRCYTTDAAGDRAMLELGRIESVLAGAFCTIYGQSPADVSRTSLARLPTWPSTWSRTTSSRTATNAPALFLRCPSLGSPALRSCCPTAPNPKTTSTTPGSRTSFPETARPVGSPKSYAAVPLRAWATRRTYRI